MRLLRSRRVWAALVVAIAAAQFAPMLIGGASSALAHPLGNFTVNRYSRVELSPHAATLRYVVDMAEIPAFQERDAVDTNGDGEISPAEADAYAHARAVALRDSVDLVIDGKRIDFAPTALELTFPKGVGGLDTLRLVVDYSAPLTDGWAAGSPQLVYHDDNYGDRTGWSEIILRTVDGVALANSDVPEQDVTNELRSYPSDGLSNPLDVRDASAVVEPGPGSLAPAVAPVMQSGAAERSNDRFTSLIASEQITLPFLLGAMAIAFAFGALHALGPGHGKTVVGAYLVGERGTAGHAVLLGLLVTGTHTSAVFALALVTLYASQFVVPERLFPWLSLTSGLLVVLLGGLLLVSRGAKLLWRRSGKEHDPHRHDHDHEDGHSHNHHVPEAISWRSLIALGVSGGMLPCPSALVVLLGAISLHRVGLGLLLVLAFSVGLASVLVAIGLGLVFAGRVLTQWQDLASRRHAAAALVLARAVPALPILSAFAVTAIGLLMTVRAIGGSGFL